MSTAAAPRAVAVQLSGAVHRRSPVPLHHQIRVALLQGIEQGWLPAGQQLPRERDLAEALGVSLAPVRQAMLELTREGYFERCRGRGTFVRDHKLVEKIQIVGGFHASVAGQGPSLDVTVIGNAFAPAPPEVVRALALRGSTAWHLRRLALLDGEPAALLTAWLPRAPKVHAQDHAEPTFTHHPRGRNRPPSGRQGLRAAAALRRRALR